LLVCEIYAWWFVSDKLFSRLFFASDPSFGEFWPLKLRKALPSIDKFSLVLVLHHRLLSFFVSARLGWFGILPAHWRSLTPRSSSLLRQRSQLDTRFSDHLLQSRALWAHNYASADGIIFLVDCSDGERLGEVKKELKQMAEDPDLNPDVGILLFANKQDIAGALKLDKVKAELNLESIIKNRQFQIQVRARIELEKLELALTCTCLQPSSTTNATGLAEGMDWLLDVLKKQPKKKKSAKEKS
jgi:hypothetical protein